MVALNYQAPTYYSYLLLLLLLLYTVRSRLDSVAFLTSYLLTGVQWPSRVKERDMEAKASKHASKCEHACARARVCVCERARARARARSLMATLPGGGPAQG